MKEGLDLLKPMLDDPVDYVRQGALLATSMLLMQSCNHGAESRLTEHRKHLQKVISDKHEDTMAKYGAIIASGILDAGGRNMTISLTTKSGNRSMSGIVGMAVFSHFWFWHPLTLFVSLALTPTAAIGINGELQMPKWKIKSSVPPSTFAYPPMTSNEKKVEEKLKMTATLSTTSKAKKKKDERDPEEIKAEEEAAAKKAATEKAEREKTACEAMLTNLGELEKKGAISSALKAELAGASADGDTAMADASSTSVFAVINRLKAAHSRGDLATVAYFELMAHQPPVAEGASEEAQPEHEVLENPARVLRTQEKHIALLPSSRYVPVVPGRRAGIIVLKDTTPDEEEDLLQVTASVPGGGAADEEEPSPPAPFEFTG